MAIETRFVYIGSYTAGSGGHGPGITLAARDPETGGLEIRSIAAELGSPTFLAWHPTLPVLYATSEPGQTVSAFRAGPAGVLDSLGVQETDGELPCHVSVYPSGKFLCVANYGSGSFSVHALGPDGRLAGLRQVVQHHGSGPNESRQEGAHVHSTQPAPGRRHLIVADLGSDTVTSYPVDPRSGAVDERAAQVARTSPGAGPRHLAIDAAAGRLYVSCELDSTVTTFALEDGGTQLRRLQAVPATAGPVTVPNFPSELCLDAAGRTLYVQNRGADVLSVFAVTAGGLRAVADVPTGGREPRHFTLAGRHLYAGNQHSDTIAQFVVEPDGVPRPAGPPVALPSPACLLPEPPGGLARRCQG